MKRKPKNRASVSMGEQSKGFGLYAPIDHTVIDSAAFADLSHSAVRVLLTIARQWNGINNGWLQATFSYCHKKGVGSEHTLQQAVESLIAHGFIYRTRGHGMIDGENIAARYAITWRPLCGKKDRVGLFLDGFLPNAFEKWEPVKNSDPQKLQESTRKKCSFRDEKLQKVQEMRPAETADYEIFAITGGISNGVRGCKTSSIAQVNLQRGQVVANLLTSGRSSVRGVVLNYRQTKVRPLAYKPMTRNKPSAMAA